MNQTEDSQNPPYQLKPDSTRLTLTGRLVNNPPRIISSDETEASGGISYSFKPVYIDNDGPRMSVSYRNYPSWLRALGDILYGIPPDGLSDSSFTAIVSDSIAADTQKVLIRMIPAIIVYGDTRTGHDAHRQLVDLMMNIKPSTVFHVGDLVNDGNVQSDWDTLNSIIGNLRSISEYYPALGNHENQSPLFFANFTLPNNEQWYSIERNDVHWIILNTCVSISPGSEQYQWLLHDLANVPDGVKFIVPVFHHPPYSTGAHAEDEKGLRDILVPLFQQYDKIRVVFNGHDHDYERSDCGGIYYIVTGGGGAPLRDQSRTYPCSQLFLKKYDFCKVSIIGQRMTIKAFDNYNNLIDYFEVQGN